eukprot:Nk52_evm40s229 gene=Nk52_evmTU40s229
MSLNISDVIEIAEEYGYSTISFQDRIRLISFSGKYNVGNGKKGDVRINVYYSTGTVGTCLDHPRQGKTQLFRRNQTLSDIRKIFQNPRVHTANGYQRLPRKIEDTTRSSPSEATDFITCLRNRETKGYLKRVCWPKDVKTEGVDRISLGFFSSSFVVQYDSTRLKLSKRLPWGLYRNLRRAKGKDLFPEFITLSKADPGQFLVSYSDGKIFYERVPLSLAQEIDRVNARSERENATGGIEVAAFGARDEFYVQFKNGEEFYSLPGELVRTLESQKAYRNRILASMGADNEKCQKLLLKATVTNISMGCEGEWYVKFGSGSGKRGSTVLGGKTNKRLVHILSSLANENDRDWETFVNHIDFGFRGDFLLTYRATP